MKKTYRYVRMTRRIGLALLAFIGLLTTSCSKDSDTDPSTASIGTDATQTESTANAQTAPRAMASLAGPSPTCVLPSPAKDAAPHEGLYPVFAALDGWTQAAPTGRSGAIGGGVMARCEYRRGPAERVIAKVALGLLGQTAQRTAETVSKTQTDPRLVQTHQVDGFAATLYQDTVTKKNWVLTSTIHDTHPAVLEMTFVGLPPAQCLELAGNFDWRAMKQVALAIELAPAQPGPGLPAGL